MDAFLAPAAKVRKTASSLRARIQSAKSDPAPPTVTDLDPTQPDESALEPASLAMFSSPPLRSNANAQDLVLPNESDKLQLDKLKHDKLFDDKLQHDKLKAQEALQKMRISRQVHLPQLHTPEQITEDMTIHRSMRLSTSAAGGSSLSWLGRLPSALRLPGTGGLGEELKGEAHAQVMEICHQSLPHLMTEPQRAVAWLAKVAKYLSWYEMEGPVKPKTGKQAETIALAQAGDAELEAQEKVREWDEAYRSLWVLLRQGLVSTFYIESERFSVTVFGEGSGPWTSPSGEVHTPTASKPIAVMWPSTKEIRSMLHENHAHFQLPIASTASDGAGVADGGASESTIFTKETLEELRELHRDGVGATSVGLREVDDMPKTSALLFEGSWRIHVMIDVLRQFFLEQSRISSPPSPARLPRLLSPQAFVNASLKTGKVVKCTDAGCSGTAELRGRFFPLNLRRFLELLRVCLPNFICELPEHRPDKVQQRGGPNAFTMLKQHRIESISCDKIENEGASWKWSFRIV